MWEQEEGRERGRKEGRMEEREGIGREKNCKGRKKLSTQVNRLKSLLTGRMGANDRNRSSLGRKVKLENKLMSSAQTCCI